VRTRLLALGLCAVLAASAAAAYAAARPPARVLVTASEFDYVLSRKSVKTGRVIFQIVNAGEDAHDLAIRRVAKRARTFRTPEVVAEEHAELNLRLAPGRYRLWCTIADHRVRGMRATLIVKR
jgi:plastocyanin